MKQRFMALVLAITLLSSVPVFAVEAERRMSEAYYYTATLYYCDSARNKIVLKYVKPTGMATTEKRRTVSDATYNEIPISCTARLKTGEYVSLEELNRYVDSEVGVVITRNKAEGIRVVALHFR